MGVPSPFDWRLEECCSRGQWITLSVWGAWVVIALALWHVRLGGFDLLLQFKLLTTFLHEFSHASAAWMTGGSVKGIEVYTNEGGVTKTVGGMQCLILPAGYLGSCVWGAVFTLLASVNVWSLRVSAALLLLMLLVVAGFYAGNCTIVCVSLLFVTEVTAAWVCTELFHTVWPLRVAMLSIGATNAVYGLLDIIDDTVKRKVPESDAYKCARLTMCSSRLCGLLWSLFALLFMTTTCYFLLAVKAVGDESI